MTFLADEVNEARGIQLKVPRARISSNSCTRAPVLNNVSRECPIADVIFSLGRDRGKRRADFVTLPGNLYRELVPFDRYGQQALRLLHLLGILRR